MALFKNFFITVKQVPTPNGENNQAVLNQLENIIKDNKVAGFVYEPLVQGAAAMKMFDTAGLNDILKFCKNNNIITIADEVMTGFGENRKVFCIRLY